MNPFRYGGVVTGKQFADREEEIKGISDDLKTGQSVIIYSPRRFGKTSLIKEIFDRLRKQGILTVYVDLYGIVSKPQFIESFSTLLATNTQDKLEEMIKTLQEYLPKPRIVVAPEGSPVPIQVEVGFTFPKKTIDRMFNDLLDAPQKIAEKKKCRIAIAFDEFQEIANFNGPEIESAMRSKFQFHTHVSYAFLGSRWHLFRQIFMKEDRPFFRFGKSYHIGKIPYNDFAAFIQERFAETGVTIEPDAISTILSKTKCHPYYTQQLCHEIWDLCVEKREVTVKDEEDGAFMVIQNNSYAYQVIFDDLPPYQKRVLQTLAKDPSESVFAADYIRKHDLKTGAHLAKALEQLQSKGIVEKENKQYTISDVFFKEWLKL